MKRKKKENLSDLSEEKFNEIIRSIKNVKNSDLDKLIDHISLIKHSRSKGSISEECLSMYKIWNNLFYEDLGKKYPPFPVLKKTNKNLSERFSRLTDEYLKWIDIVLKKKLSKTEKVRAFSLLYKLLEGSLNSMSLPLSLKTMVSVSDDFPSLFEEQFPGYIKAGLLHLVLCKNV